MNEIASPEQLQSGLQSILDYSQGKSPSRAKVASDLRSLADRLVVEKTANAKRASMPKHALLDRAIIKALKEGFAAGQSSGDDPDDARLELRDAITEAAQSMSSLLRGGHPMAAFMNVASNVWEAAYWAGALSRK